MLEKLPLKMDLETKEVLKQLSKTSRALAELKGIEIPCLIKIS